MTQVAFDFDTAIRLRDHGIMQTYLANEDFVRWARGYAIRYARMNGDVHIDAIRRAAVSEGYAPQSSSAWGAIFHGKQWEKTGEYRQSTYVSNHGHASPVWRWRG